MYESATGMPHISCTYLLQRISAAEALNHEFFKELPLPCPEDAMPTFRSRHEEEES